MESNLLLALQEGYKRAFNIYSSTCQRSTLIDAKSKEIFISAHQS